MHSNATKGDFMKKLICIFVCIMTLFGCSSKSNDKSNGQEDIIADETQENKDLAGNQPR